MEKFEEICYYELKEINGGILPLLAAGVVFAGKVASYACYLLVGDIILNCVTYSKQIDDKLAKYK
jgi:lactobin A/cerein 7B family class IIb bacteriocin